jgi:hypothetical protein
VSVTVTVPPDPGQQRLWGIPWLGILVRWLLCIPQLVVLAVLGFVLYLTIFVSWIPILVNGRQANAIVDLFSTVARIQSRTTLFVMLATGAYPWFNALPEHPIQVHIDRDEPQHRLWGIPFFGIVVRAILCIPHAIVIWLLGIGAGFLILVSWIPILVNGRQADAIVGYLGGVYRYSLRVGSYVVLVTGTYPPFRLGD